MKTTLKDHFRIVMAISQKDIIDGIKNKNVISLVITAIFLLIFYRYLPSITESMENPRLVVLDTDQSEWVEVIDDLPDFDLRTSESLEDLKNHLAALDWISMGVVLPETFDSQVNSGQPLELTGYAPHWVDQEELAELTTFFEGQLSQATGQSVHITISDELAYPDANTKGPGFLASVAVAIVSSMAGVMILTHLLIEERQRKTLDLLMVSPASYTHIAIAKLLAGTFFGLILAAVALYANAYLVTYWPAAILAVLIATLFNTALGLLIGSFIETRQQLTIWGMVLINILLIPAFLEIMDDIFPSIVITLFQWHPAVALTHALRLTYTETFDLGAYLPRIGLLVLYTILTVGLIVWKLRRDER
jgi:ABC-2 type transport system permease protein